jgi:hypothetical protein
MRRGVYLLCGLLVAALALAACDEDKAPAQSPTPIVGATATPRPLATPLDAEPRTGVPEIDQLIAAMLVEPPRERREAIRPLLGSTQLACTFRTDLVNQGLKPPCRADEAEGDLVEAFSYDSCGLAQLRADEVDEVVILLGSAFMYGVYPPSAQTEEIASADYAAIVYQVIGGEQQAVYLPIRDGRVVSYYHSCSQTPADYAASLGLSDPLYQAEDEGG